MSNLFKKEKKLNLDLPVLKLTHFLVLGRFLHKLNEFCKDEYGLDVDISDYHVYEFAKVRRDWREG